MCHNTNCNCQKQITSTHKQIQLEGGSIKSKLQKIFQGTQTAWKKFLKPAISATAPFLGMAVSAKTKKPKAGQATTKLIKSISDGKLLCLIDMHRNGSRLPAL